MERKDEKQVLLSPRFSIKRARIAQKRIADLVIERDEIDFPIRHAVGVDVAFKGKKSIGAAVVISYPELKVVEREIVVVDTVFPYIPTLLAFREILPAYMALKRIRTSYQLVFVDGNGRLHPYKAGFACHLGVLINRPTIGIAKKLLTGRISRWQNSIAYIYLDGEIIGAAVKTRKGSRPIYVSIGNKVSLNTAIKLTIAFTKRGLKLPEPIRQAHIAANEYKRKFL